jgi:hypothetical protein
MINKDITNIQFNQFASDYLKTAVKYNNNTYFSIDRLTTVFPCTSTDDSCFFNEDLNKIISDKYDNLLSDPSEQEYDILYADDEKGLYHYNKKIVLANGDPFFLSWGYRGFDKHLDSGKVEPINNIRLDFNPNKININSLTFILSLLHPVSYNKMKITRIDYAVDYLLDLDFSLAYDKYIRSGNLYYKFLLGITTLYLGSKQSARQLRFYNKHLELFEKSKLNLDSPLTRLECQIRRNWDCYGTKNPYKSLDIKKFTICDDPVIGSCIKEIKEIGLTPYLSKFSTQRKRLYFKKKISPYLINDERIINPKIIYDKCYSKCMNNLKKEIHEIYLSVRGKEYFKYEELRHE